MNVFNKKKGAKVFLQNSLQFFINIVKTRTLDVRRITLLDKVILNNNEIQFLWDIKGCHKIKIKNVGIFSGKIHGLKFIYKNDNNPIEITFFGIGKRITKTIGIKSTKVEFLNNFDSQLYLEKVEKVLVNKPIINHLNLNKINSKFSSASISVKLKNVSFQFDKFNLEKYK